MKCIKSKCQTTKAPFFVIIAFPSICLFFCARTYSTVQLRSLGATPSIPEMIWGKNVRAIVVYGFLIKILKEKYPENLKKIVGALWELPAKYHSQSSPIPLKLG